jgi:hypothetical protein
MDLTVGVGDGRLMWGARRTMHVTHLDNQIIATRGVLALAIPHRGVAKPRSCE